MRYELNQYRTAASLVKHRLKWDISVFGRVQKRRVTSWEDRMSGGRAVILCNGPSLNRTDFDALQASGLFVFGLNKINLLFPRVQLRPNVIVAVNQKVIEQNAEFFRQTTIPLFLDASARSVVPPRDNVFYLFSSGPDGTFSTDLRRGINQGFTVTYAALQVAFYMGFREVALVGADHTFAVKGPANAEAIASGPDRSHFDPNYFADGVPWDLPDLVGSEYHYQVADIVYTNAGRSITNCTDGGALEIYAKSSLADFINRE